MPPLTLTLPIAASAALTLWAEHRDQRRAFYLLKPLTTVLILALAATAPQPVSRGYQALVCADLLFSLIGDMFLMLPRDRLVAGLASFLVAHLFYVAAFAPRPMTLAEPLVLAVLVIYADSRGGAFMKKTLGLEHTPKLSFRRSAAQNHPLRRIWARLRNLLSVCWWPVPPAQTRPYPAVVRPHVRSGLPRLSSRGPKVDSSALQPAAREANHRVAGPRNDSSVSFLGASRHWRLDQPRSG